MLISVLNIKLTCEWHKAIKLNYKNTRTYVIVVLRVPSTIHDTWMPSTDVTWLTAHSGISLLHICTKIQYLLYSNCSKFPPPAAMQLSARIKRDWVAEAMLSGWLRMCSAASVSWIAVIWHHTQGRTWIRLSADRYSAWTRQKTTLLSGHYLRNRSTLDIGFLGYIGIL